MWHCLTFRQSGYSGDVPLKNAPKENPRAARTQKSIRDAFKTLLINGKQEDINIKKIAEMAGIHRKTFYLHYTCIEALYEDMIQNVISDYGKEVEKLSIPYDYYDLTRIMFEFYTADPFREKLVTDPRYQDFSLKIMARNLLHNRKGYNPFERYSADEQMMINNFLAGASTDIFRFWVSSGKKMPMDEVTELTGRLLEGGASSLRSAQSKNTGQHFPEFTLSHKQKDTSDAPAEEK